MKQVKQDHDGQENSLTLKTLISAMKGWCVRFKDRQPDEAEMTFLAKEYFRDLLEESVTHEEFAFAERQVCKSNRFFPVMADIMVFVKEDRDAKHSAYLAQLKWRNENEWKKNHPELLTPEQRILLGVSQQAIEAAVDRGDIDKRELDKVVQKLAHGMAAR